jgi:hypothetical protein
MTVLVFLGLSFNMFTLKGLPLPWCIKWIELAIGVVISIVAIAYARSVQEVEVGDHGLRVSGWQGREEIPFEAIRAVDQTILLSPKLIVIQLNRKSRFGERVRFIPEKWYSLFSQDPIIDMLERKIVMRPPPLPNSR